MGIWNGNERRPAATSTASPFASTEKGRWGGGGRATERDVKIIRMRKIINQHLTPAGITSNRGGENSFHSSNLGIIGMMKSVQDKFPDL